MSIRKLHAPAALVVSSSRGLAMDAGNPHLHLPVPLHMSPLPESLLSPVDPGFLEGASSLARFGLDIGGTLCKVVFFEPITPVDGNNLSKRMLKSKLSQVSAVGANRDGGEVKGPGRFSSVECNCGVRGKACSGDCSGREAFPRFESDIPSRNNHRMVNETQADSHRGSAIFGETSKKQEENLQFGKAVVDPPHCNGETKVSGHEDIFSVGRKPDSPPQLQKGIQSDSEKGNHVRSGVADLVACECSRSSPKARDFIMLPANHKKDGITGEGGGGEEVRSKKESSQRQAQKIWVSSHDPVCLPGRGTLYFKCFETWRMEEFLSLTKEHSLVTKGRALGATGGGARKFGDQFVQIAGLQLQHADELKSLVRGIDFLARHAYQESFEYPLGAYKGGVIQRPWLSPENSSDDGDSDCSGDESPSRSPNTKETSDSLAPVLSTSATCQPDDDSLEQRKAGKKEKGSLLRGPVLATPRNGWLGGSEALYPYLVVNIGSGVSILRVDSADKFERVGGTSLGGSTFLGLASALTGCTSFEEAIGLAIQGDSTQIDMLVGDIYGGDYTEMGLAATTVASSFGKLVEPKRRDAAMQAPQNLAKAVLLMVTNNIGSIAMLHARAAGVRQIMFTGSFLHENKLAMRLLSVAMEFWSKGNIKAIFLRHEGHAGAVGALFSTLEQSNPIDALLLNSS